MISYYTSLVEVHPAAKHGIADEDIEHAVKNAMTIDDQNNDTPALPRTRPECGSP